MAKMAECMCACARDVPMMCSWRSLPTLLARMGNSLGFGHAACFAVAFDGVRRAHRKGSSAETCSLCSLVVPANLTEAVYTALAEADCIPRRWHPEGRDGISIQDHSSRLRHLRLVKLLRGLGILRIVLDCCGVLWQEMSEKRRLVPLLAGAHNRRGLELPESSVSSFLFPL